MSFVDIKGELDGLFRKPVSAFVKARNELAKKLRDHKLPELSAEIRGLTRPTPAAWAVNQAFFQDRDAFARLLEVGQRFREAQNASALDVGALREAQDAHRRQVDQLMRRTEEVLQEAGKPVNASQSRRIRSSLEALSLDEGAPEPGRLTRDLSPPGFDLIAVHAAEASKSLGARPKRKSHTLASVVGSRRKAPDLPPLELKSQQAGADESSSVDFGEASGPDAEDRRGAESARPGEDDVGDTEDTGEGDVDVDEEHEDAAGGEADADEDAAAGAEHVAEGGDDTSDELADDPEDHREARRARYRELQARVDDAETRAREARREREKAAEAADEAHALVGQLERRLARARESVEVADAGLEAARHAERRVKMRLAELYEALEDAESTLLSR